MQTDVAEYFAPYNLPMMDRNWFPPEFLTGCDVNFVIAQYDESMSISGYLEHHVVDFQFGLVQVKRPVYSYASFRWDRVAVGNMIVQGLFAVPFTSKFSVFSALKLATNEFFKGEENSNAATAQITANWDNLPLEDKIKVLKDGDMNAVMESTLSQSLATNSPTEEGEILGHTDRFGIGELGLEIAVYYGNAETRVQRAFDALKDLKIQASQDPSSKVITLHQVHLNQNTQVIRPKGAPVMEQYQFIARDFS